MGDPACWLDQVCVGCDRVTDDLDEQRRCADCAEASADGDEVD